MKVFTRFQDGNDDGRFRVIRDDAGVKDVVEFMNNFIFIGDRKALKDVDGNIILPRGGSFGAINGSVEFIIRDRSIHDGILAAKVERKMFMVYL